MRKAERKRERERLIVENEIEKEPARLLERPGRQTTVTQSERQRERSFHQLKQRVDHQLVCRRL